MAATSSSYYNCCSCCCYYLFFLLVCFLLPSCAHCRSRDEDAFSFEGGFGKNGTFGAEIALRGGAEIRASAVVLGGLGRMESRRPFRFFGARPGFAAYFSFVSTPGDNGPAFFPVPALADAGANSSEMNKTASSAATAAVQVEFAAETTRKNGNVSGMFIRIRVGNQDLVRSKNLPGDLVGGGKKLHTWIDYDGDTKRIQVRASASMESKPRNATISYQIDLSNVLWRYPMLRIG